MTVYNCFIFGESHYHADERERINNAIRAIRPDYILHELLYEDESYSMDEIKSKLDACTTNGLACDTELNEDIYELGYELGVKG